MISRRILFVPGLVLALGAGATVQARPPTVPPLPPTATRAEPVETLTSQQQKMLRVAKDLASACERTLTRWLDSKEVSEAKLFSFLYYPIEGTDPPKFNTDWDRLSDRDILALEERALETSSAMIFAILVDKHGYLPTHNRRYSQELTGDMAVDLVNNRTKRIFADRTGYAAAINVQPYLIQHYSRDTGEQIEDLSVPVYVRGRKWGSVRLGYRVVNEE